MLPHFSRRRWLLLFLNLTTWILLSLFTFSQPVFAGPKDFPVYGTLRANVRFWENIYSLYSLKDAVIHDQDDLSKVYAVLKMRDSGARGANEYNKKLRKNGLKKYRKILARLVHQAPKTPEEKRVAAMFPPGKSGRRSMAKASKNLRIQTGQKERFKEGVIRSGAYIDAMKQIFRRAGMPEDLAYLPHVESSFNPKAYSKFGAAGVWQFTRATGRQYLSITDAVDERLDPISATRGAAAYLKNSYGELRNWPLALTSYNYGLAGMVRASQMYGSYERVFQNYRKGHFKFASQNFYSEFLAARKVAKKMEKNPHIPLHHPTRYTSMTLKGYVSLATVSLHFQIGLDKLRELNPALRPPVFKGQKFLPRGYKLRLPHSSSIVRLLRTFPDSNYQATQRPSRFHRVQSGDTAGGIARKYRISLKSLIQANNLDRNATIYVHQRLKLPGVAPRGSKKKRSSSRLVAYIPAQSKRFANAQQPLTHEIKTIYATRKKTKFDALTPQVPAKDPTAYSVAGLYRENGLTYGNIIVQPEESIELFSSWLTLSPKHIRQLNRLRNGQDVPPGKTLRMSFQRISPEEFIDKRLDFLQETEDDFFAGYSIKGRKLYRVRSGDTLWDLCYNKFDIPLWLLRRYNSTINLSRLNVDQQLVIPVIQPI